MSDNDVNSDAFNTSSNTTRSTLSDFSFSDVVGLDGTLITHQTPITNMVINSNEQQNTIGNAAGNLAQQLNGFMSNFHNVNNMFTQVDQLNDNNNILNSSDLSSYSTFGSNNTTLSTEIHTDNETNSHSNTNPNDIAFMVGGLKKMTSNEFNKLVLKMNELSIILNKIKVTNKMKKSKKMKNKKKTKKNKKTIKKKNKNNNHNGGGKRKRSIHSASTKKSVSKSSKDSIKKNNNFIIPSNLIFNNDMNISPLTT